MNTYWVAFPTHVFFCEAYDIAEVYMLAGKEAEVLGLDLTTIKIKLLKKVPYCSDANIRNTDWSTLNCRNFYNTLEKGVENA